MRIHNLFQFARESLTQIETSVQWSQLCAVRSVVSVQAVLMWHNWLVGSMADFFFSNFDSSFLFLHRMDSIVQSILSNDVITMTCLHFTSATLFGYIKTNEETVRAMPSKSQIIFSQ